MFFSFLIGLFFYFLLSVVVVVVSVEVLKKSFGPSIPRHKKKKKKISIIEKSRHTTINDEKDE